ncbi:MAG: aldose 1-epimerase family protein [Steroidobacteraceae bacterium]
MSDAASNWISLRSSALEVKVDPQGAQLSSLRDAQGREYLWHGDPAIWAGRAPILFPIVGALNDGQFRHGGRRYRLGRHGFARGSLFALVNSSPTSAVFRRQSTADTLAVYPFPFRLDIEYQLEGHTLAITASVCNDGDERMPASLGFHPGFLWPLPDCQRAGHSIEFDDEEPAPIRRIDAQGLLLPEGLPTPIVGRRLILDDALFREDVIILDTFTSRRARLCSEKGPSIEVGFPDARYLGLWTKPGAPFVCIEPWQGVTDPAGFAGDFAEKPGIFQVEPGATHSFGMTIGIRGQTVA